MSTGRVGQGQQFRPQTGVQQQKDTGKSKETKDAKGTEGKGSVAGEAKSGGVKSKGKAKGKDLGTVGGLIAGEDDWALEDEEQDRKRRSNKFFDNDLAPADVKPEDFDEEFSMLENIPREFRGQVASGLAAARSFTRGNVGPKPDDEAEEAPRKAGKG